MRVSAKSSRRIGSGEIILRRNRLRRIGSGETVPAKSSRRNHPAANRFSANRLSAKRSRRNGSGEIIPAKSSRRNHPGETDSLRHLRTNLSLDHLPWGRIGTLALWQIAKGTSNDPKDRLDIFVERKRDSRSSAPRSQSAIKVARKLVPEALGRTH